MGVSLFEATFLLFRGGCAGNSKGTQHVGGSPPKAAPKCPSEAPHRNVRLRPRVASPGEATGRPGFRSFSWLLGGGKAP